MSGQKFERSLFFVIGLLIAIVILKELKVVFLPIVVAIFLASLLRPVLRYFKRLGFPGSIAVLVIVLIMTGVLSIAAFIFYVSAEQLVELVGLHETYLRDSFQSVLQMLPPWLRQQIPGVGNDSQWAHSFFSEFLISYNSSFVTIGSLAVAIVLVVFILEGEGRFTRKIAEWNKQDGGFAVQPLVHRLETEIEKYLVTFILLRIATALITMIVLIGFGGNLILFWSFLAFILHFVPTIGSVIATAGPIAMYLAESGSLGKSLCLALVLITSKGIFNSYLSPKIMGKVLRLSPVVIVVSLLFWGWAWGIVGLILAVPIMATIKIALEIFPQTSFYARLLSN